MNATRPVLVTLAAIAIGATCAPASIAQTTTSGTQRYLGTTQQSIGRTNAAIASMAPSTGTFGGGSTGMISAATQSVNRTNAAMQSMRTNRAATVRGLAQQAIYRTPDNLYGVYWQNYYMRRAQLYGTYSATQRSVNGNGLVTTIDQMRLANVAQMRMADNVRRRVQQKARGEEIIRRQNRLNPMPDPTGSGFGPDTIRTDITAANFENFTEAGMINQPIDITAPVPITPSMTRRRSTDD